MGADRIIVKDTAMNEGTLKYVSAVVKAATTDHRGSVTSSAIMCHDTRGHIWMDEREQKSQPTFPANAFPLPRSYWSLLDLGRCGLPWSSFVYYSCSRIFIQSPLFCYGIRQL